MSGRAGEAYALALDDPADEFGLRGVGVRRVIVQHAPCRPPRPGHLRTCKVDASGRELAPPGLHRGEIDRQLAPGDPEHIGATTDPLSDRDLACKGKSRGRIEAHAVRYVAQVRREQRK